MIQSSLIFKATPASTIPLPNESTNKILFLDEDLVFKTLSFTGEVALLGSNDKQLVKETLVQVASKGAIDDSQYLAIKKLLLALEKKDLDLVNEINKLRVADEELKRNYSLLANDLRDKVVTLKAELLAKLPPETVVAAGKLTYGSTDELTVRYSENIYFIDLQLKNTKPETTFVAGGGATKSWVEQYFIDNAIGKTLVQSSSGSILVTEIANGWNIEVPPPVIPLNIISFTGGGTYELGDIVPSTNLSWSINYEPDTSLSINQGIGSLPLSSSSYVFSTPISSDLTFTLSASDSIHGNDSASTSVSFINRRYWGVTSSATELINDDIVALTSELSNSRVKTFSSFPCSGNHFLYAYPKHLGLATVRDGNNNIFQDWISGVSPYEVTVINTFGFTEDFYVYHSFNIYFGNPTFQFT